MIYRQEVGLVQMSMHLAMALLLPSLGIQGLNTLPVNATTFSPGGVRGEEVSPQLAILVQKHNPGRHHARSALAPRLF